MTTDFETLAIKHPEMKEAVRMIQELSWVKRHRMMVEQRRLEKYDWIVLKREAEQEAREAGHAAGHAAGHEEGLKEGHATGLEASRREIAKKMKIRGDSAAGIAEITGLSQEVIEKL
jgi:flagellar biosynthesis/type III secretory pathway protein FliH